MNLGGYDPQDADTPKARSTCEVSMWNYSFVFPSVLVMLTLLVFFLARRRLPIRMNRVFLGVLLVHLCVVLFDIISSRADENYALHTAGQLYALNTAFFIFYLARIFWFYLFTMTILDARPGRLMMILSTLPFAFSELVAASSCFTGLVFTIRDGMYARGPLYDIIYFCSFFYCLLSIAMILLHGRHMKPTLMAAALGYNIVLLVGNVARLIFSNYLIMGTFSMIAIQVIYLAFLNPDLYLTDRGPAFNMRGFQAVLSEISPHRKYHILGFILQNYSQERSILGGDQMDQGITQINHYLSRSFPEALPFYLRSGRFVLLGKASAPWAAIQREIAERFQSGWPGRNAPIYLGITFASITSESNLSSADRIISNLTLAFEDMSHAATTFGEDASASLQEIDQQVDILRSLERALERDAVEVFLQPVVDSHTGGIVAAEALARIRDDQGRVIPPGLFIPIAERGGFINQLGEQVFEKTCAFISGHDLAGLGLSWINVNLSPIQCMQRDLAKRFGEILKRHNTPVESIHLEITEQSMVDYSMLQRQIRQLQDAGFQFVLDDYGSGYSNLTRVKHYPFINIKLDMEVVWDYFRDRDSLLPTIIQGFKKMGFSITAEGIETKEMADVLTGIGADYLQGYLFSRPLPMEEFLEKYGK